MAPTHRAAILPLCLGLALAPGRRPGASATIAARQVEIDVAQAKVAAARVQCAGLPGDGVYTVAEGRSTEFGYKLLQAGRVDDAIAFFELNVGGHRRAEVARMSR